MSVWVISPIYAKADRLSLLQHTLFPLLNAGDTLVYAGGYLGFNPDVDETMTLLLDGDHPDATFLKGTVEKTLATFEHLHLQHKPEVWLQTLDPALYDPILNFYGFSFEFLCQIAEKGAVSLARFSEDFRVSLRKAGHATFFHHLKKSAGLPILDPDSDSPLGVSRKDEGFTFQVDPDPAASIYAVELDPETGYALRMLAV